LPRWVLRFKLHGGVTSELGNSQRALAVRHGSSLLFRHSAFAADVTRISENRTMASTAFSSSWIPLGMRHFAQRSVQLLAYAARSYQSTQAIITLRYSST